MKRIDIVYDGTAYSVADRDLADLEREVAELLGSGVPGWLTVNIGEGHVRPARLLITPGVSLAISAEPTALAGPTAPAEPDVSLMGSSK